MARVDRYPSASRRPYETLAWMMRSFDLAIDDDIPNLDT